MSLPLDIIEIILSKLSVKPLIRFKSVCKPWNIMISDPVFVRNLHQRSKNSNSENLFLCHSTLNGLSVVKIEDRKFKTLQNIKCPYGRGRWRLCSSEGVMLLPTDGTFRRFALWNPSTRAHAKLQHRRSCRMASFGLCRDPITDDFRVVIVNSDYYSVYSCNSESWMMLEKEYEIEHTGKGLQNRAGVCVDGASYWVRTRHNLSAQIVYLLKFIGYSEQDYARYHLLDTLRKYFEQD